MRFFLQFRDDVKLGKLELEDVASYKKTSSTTSYRNHLSRFHLERWVACCDHLKIQIGGEEFQADVNRVRQQKPNQSGNDGLESRLAFSAEAFVDAIIDFVVGDDQVSLITLIRLEILIN